MSDQTTTQNVKTSADNSNDNNDNNDSNHDIEEDKLAQGILGLLAPVVQEMDTRMTAVRTSQLELNKEIERLLAELQLFNEANKPPPVQAALQKLVNARKRLTTTNATLKTVHDRVDKMYVQLNKSSGNS